MIPTIMLIEWPIRTGNQIHYLVSQEGVEELKKLYDKEDLTNFIIEIPLKNTKVKLKEIKDLSLRKLFNKHSGKDLLILSEKFDKYEKLTIQN